MLDVIKNKMNELADICERRGVVRLWLFGSAASESPAEEIGDLDFLVEFRSMTPGARADAFFGLQEELQSLFGMPVDLIEPGPVRNPFFRKSMEETRIMIYEAA